MSSKAKIGILIGLIAVLIAALIALVVVDSLPKNTPQPTQNSDNQIEANATSNSQSGSATTGTKVNANIQNTNNNNNASGEPFKNVNENANKEPVIKDLTSQYVTTDPNTEVIYNEEADRDGESDPPVFDPAKGEAASQRVEDVAARSNTWNGPLPDQEKAMKVADNFIQGFYNYNQASINDGSYLASYSPYLAPEALDASKSKLISQHSALSWQRTMGAEKQTTSLLQSASVNDCSVNSVTHPDAILVTATIGVGRNQGVPGDMEWGRIVRYRIELAVYLNAHYQVVDVREQTIKGIV